MVFGNYFTDGILVKARQLTDIDDTLDDDTFKVLGETAGQEVDTWLAPWAESLPFLEGSDFFIQVQNAIIYKVAALWKAKKKDKDLATFWNGQFKDTMGLIVEKLKRQPSTTNRSKRVSVPTEHATKLLFSQTKKF